MGGRVAQLGEYLVCKRRTKFDKSCRSRRKPLKSSKLSQNPASRFSPFCSLSVRNLRQFVATCTTFLLRWRSSVVHDVAPSRKTGKPSPKGCRQSGPNQVKPGSHRNRALPSHVNLDPHCVMGRRKCIFEPYGNLCCRTGLSASSHRCRQRRNIHHAGNNHAADRHRSRNRRPLYST